MRTITMPDNDHNTTDKQSKKNIDASFVHPRIKVLTTLRQIWELLVGTRKRMIVLFLYMMFNSVLGLFGIGLIIPFTTLLQNMEYVNMPYDVNTVSMAKRLLIQFSRYIYETLNFSDPTQIVVFYGILFLVLFVCRTLFGLLVEYKITRHSLEATKHITAKVYSVFLYMSYTYYLGRSIAKNSFVIGLSGKCSAIILGFLHMFNDVLFMILLGAGIIFWSPSIVLIFLFFFIISIIVYRTTRMSMQKLGAIETTLQAKNNAEIYKSLVNFSFSRLFNAEKYFIEHFKDVYSQLVPVTSRKTVLQSVSRVVLEIMVIVCFVLYILYTLFFTPDQIGDVITTLAVLGAVTFKLMPAIIRIVGFFSYLVGDQAAINELYEEYHTALIHKTKEIPTNITPLPFKKMLEVQNIQYSYPVFDEKWRTFSYDNSKPVLKNISLTINAGERIGLFGSSGGGKTTLANIIMAFLSPLRGNILVDGVDIHDNVRYWQKNIGYVPQETILMDDSIMTNIAFGERAEHVDEEKVKSVLQTAQLWDVIQRLPQGIHTNIGDHGKRLSGGQRQRLGIARALYRDPAIIVFDEATSHLDTATEKDVQTAINNLPRDKTLIIIAHRLNTLSICDRIFKIGQEILFRGDYNAMQKEVTKEE